MKMLRFRLYEKGNYTLDIRLEHCNVLAQGFVLPFNFTLNLIIINNKIVDVKARVNMQQSL